MIMTHFGRYFNHPSLCGYPAVDFWVVSRKLFSLTQPDLQILNTIIEQRIWGSSVPILTRLDGLEDFEN